MVLIAVAAVLAAASALRYYLVTTLGERVVADLRASVFDHLTGLSPALLRQRAQRRTRVAPDGRHDADQDRRRDVDIGRAAQSRAVSRLGGDDGGHQPAAFLFVLAAIPVIVLPLVAFGRLVRRRSRTAQDTLADASAYAAELIGAMRILQAFTNEKLATGRFPRRSSAPIPPRSQSTRARAWLTAVVIFLVFASVVVVLWVGAQDVVDQRITAGRLSQFVLYAVFAAGALGELSQMFGEISQAAGAAERLSEVLVVRADDRCAAESGAAARARAGRGRLRPRALRLSGAAGNRGARRRLVPHPARARRWPSSAPRARARARSSI